MLYHYTSLTTFALILATNSIKFNRLDLMDDMDESAFGYGESNMKINSFSFASCWTSDALENIALWKMYADLKGVRIGLDEDMFVTHNTEYGISFLEKPYYREGNLSINYSVNDIYPHPIKYDLKDDDNAIKFYRECASPQGADILLHTNEIGIHKKEYWSFQKESRFIIRGFSVDEKGKMIDEPIGREEFFIPFKMESLKKMEVLLGPKAGNGERLIVDALIFSIFQNDHAINVKDSIVKIR